MQQNWLPKRNILMGVCNAREDENTQRLDKLPHEVWDKILDHLGENDLFPLALSCRYFCQKQKELVERARQSGSGSEKRGLTLKTTFHHLPEKAFGQPVSAEYLLFCSKEKVSRYNEKQIGWCMRCLAAYHGYLPLLQELLKHLETLEPDITNLAGESPSSQAPLLLCSVF